MTAFANFDTDFVREKGQIVGLNLGYSYTSSHEWGISPVQMDRICGYSKGLEGMDPEMVRLFVYNDGQEALLVQDQLYELTCEMKGREINYPGYFEDMLKRYGNYFREARQEGMRDARNPCIDAIWDANQFAVRFKGEEAVKAISELYPKLMAEGFVYECRPHSETCVRPRLGLMIRMPEENPMVEASM